VDTNDIYLVGPSGAPYDMYVWINGGTQFVKVGNTTVDVSGKVDITKTVGLTTKTINNDTGYTAYNPSAATTYEYGYKTSGDNVLQVVGSSVTSGLKVSPTAAELAVSSGTSAGRLIVGSDYKAYYVKGTGAATASDEIATVGNIEAFNYPASIKYSGGNYTIVVEYHGTARALKVYTVDDSYNVAAVYSSYTTNPTNNA